MKFIRCGLVAIFLGAEFCHAAPPVIEESGLVAFADSLMRQQRFRESELEYERFAATHPDDPGRMMVLQKMFDAAMATRDYSFTLKLARAWETQLSGPGVCVPAVFEGQALYQMGNYPAVLNQALPPACETNIADENRYLRGLSRLRLWEWPEARREFDQIPSDSTLAEQARRASQKSFEGPMIARKSPGLAAGLNAVLPGAGYAYADRPQTAAACFVVNGLFIWGTVASVHAKEPGLAALLSMFSFAWYWGGVYGSAQAARKETDSRLSALVGPLELAH